jgi:hypothetical protein
MRPDRQLLATGGNGFGLKPPVADLRACPRVLNLMYPSRTRGALSV